MTSILQRAHWRKPFLVDEVGKFVSYDLGPRGIVTMPIVEGREDRRGFYGLWIQCPYCGERHLHSEAEGTRIAHCRNKPRTPFPLEYYIRPAGATGPYLGWGEDDPRDPGHPDYVLTRLMSQGRS
jgi:hypothetical protein